MKKLRIEVSPEIHRCLEKLLATGFYGTTVAGVAERLLSDALVHEIHRGILSLTHTKPPLAKRRRE